MNRPLVEMSISMIIGIIGGTMWIDNLQLPLFLVFIVLLGSIFFLSRQRKYKYLLIESAIVVISFIMTLNHPVISERELFSPNTQVEVIGRVIKQVKNPYSIQVTLDKVELKKGKQVIRVRSRIIVVGKQSKVEYEEGEWIRCKGKILDESRPMNPSDMNYENYLRGRDIVIRIKGEEVRVIGKETLGGSQLRRRLKQQIHYVFRGKDKGVITGILLGEDEVISEEVEKLYFKLGIGHLLALSGFHLGLIATMIMFICKKIGSTYRNRYVISFLAIWGYTLLTGGAISTVRAAIMISVLVVGRCLWEEEDGITSLTLAALIILINNPFAILQVGFQLSFGAIIGVLLGNRLVEEYEAEKEWGKLQKKVMYSIAVPLGIFVMISPILAYHFFEIPFLIQVINFMMIPLFSLLIPCMIVCLAISLLSIPLANGLGVVIIKVLEGIETIGEVLVEIPLAHLVIGRPNIISIMGYYIVIGGIILVLTHKISRYHMQGVVIGVGILLCVLEGYNRQWLEITQLYVGQGDSTVIITPKKKAIIIDGGPSGKGRTIEQYLKYRGLNRVEAAIISHPHEDHLMGVMELIESGYRVENVFMASGEYSDQLLEEFYKVCKGYSIPVYEWKEDGKIKVEEMELECIWPIGESTISDINENSLVMQLSYGKFKALYTGDIGKETESLLNGYLKDIDVLKVAHHGSKNSTAEEFLLQIRPEYAIISCGLNNVYSHPHQETLNLLEKYPVKVFRTDLKGAVTIYVTKKGEIKRIRSQK